MTFARQIGVFAEEIRLAHTLFALPFAAVGALYAAGGLPAGRTCAWILVAMVGARTAAMGFNRLADARFDAANPRTAARAIPSGRLSIAVAAAASAAAAGLFLLAAARLNPLAGRLAPAALAIVLGYSWTKRVTAASHLFLGAALACAPAGGWIAVAGRLEPAALLLSGAVVAWVAGFDILYALADEAFDRAAGLRSVPAALGAAAAVRLSAALHALAVLLLVLFGRSIGAGPAWFAGTAGAAALLAWEQALVRRGLDRLPTAFFTANAWVGAVVLAGCALDLALRAA